MLRETMKKKKNVTSIGGFDQLDAVIKPHKKPTRETPATAARKPTSAKRPKSAKKPR